MNGNTEHCIVCGNILNRGNKYGVCHQVKDKAHSHAIYVAKGNATRPGRVKSPIIKDGISYVYAIYFPTAGLLKIGGNYVGRELYSAKQRAMFKGFHVEDAVTIWRKPGDYRHEAYIQGYLGLSGLKSVPEFDGSTRLCEWFKIDKNLDLFDGSLKSIIDGLNRLLETASTSQPLW